ncbi:MAG: serine--tRNA ligase [archaeon]
MIDIKLIREQPEKVKENIKKKFQDHKLHLVDDVRKKDEEWRKLKGEVDSLRAERNKVSLQISEAKKAGKNTSDLMKKAKDIPEKIAEIEAKTKKLEEEILVAMRQIPNIIHHSVPTGRDSSENVVRKVIGKPKKLNFPVKNHIEIAENLGIIDFDTAAEVSGNGFYYLIGDLARLNQALIRFGIDFMVKKGYMYMETPLMIHSDVVNGVMSFEEMQNMMYKIEGEDLFLIGTSEHSLIGFFKNKALDLKQMPQKLTSYSACFRKEVGSHGINEKGLFRTHQFNKVEMVVICKPEESYKFYDEMLKHSIDIYKQLGIPARVLECCSGDLADLKAKSCDLEFWSPAQNKYAEIGSLTNMEGAQARRLNIKFIDKNGEKKFAHTLNNTAIATSRVMVAILENYQQKDGSVKIPTALQKYMGGTKKIVPKKP